MSNPYFQFKQFTVYHDLCAMKVGTDGVLLGAWTDCRGSNDILDVGTGSGLIALMLAQRSEARIDALDIDEGACTQAICNVNNSIFKDRINVIRSDYGDFNPEKQYDLIVSNPPYFSNSLQALEKKRNLARHNHALSFEVLIKKSAELLTAKGKLALILPIEAFDIIRMHTENAGLFLCRKTLVRPKQDVPPKRILLEYSNIKCLSVSSEIYIEKERHVYSEEFRNLTTDFYLK